ncbi:hypothetical protein D9M68_766040 [compost metagenome]
MHQLQVIDNDHLDIVLRLQPPAFRPEFKDIQRWGIINKQRCLRECTDLAVQLLPFPLGEITFTYFFLLNLGFARNEPVYELH